MNKLSERMKAIGAAVAAIEKQFGKGAVMRLGEADAALAKVVKLGGTDARIVVDQ